MSWWCAIEALSATTLEEDEMLSKSGTVFANDERMALLQISYRESLKYVTQGLGLEKYSGNSKQEREQHLKLEAERHL